MYIEAVPNRNSPPAILLRESYRHEGKVRKRTLCNLSDWSPAHVEGLRGVLKGGTVIPAGQDAFTVTRSLPHGHVAAALGTARKIGLDRILGPESNRCRDLVLALLLGRILDPASKPNFGTLGKNNTFNQYVSFLGTGLSRDWGMMPGALRPVG